MTPGEELKAELDYAWNWFQYSASQRLTTFNFYLVIIGLLLVAYAQAIEHEWRLFGASISLVGAIVSVGFLAIDVRNEVFVNRGIAALEKVEDGMKVEIAKRGEASAGLEEALGEGWIAAGAVGWIKRAPTNSKEKKRANLFKYRFWFRRIIGVIGVAFVAGLMWAALGFPTAGQSDAETCRTATVMAMHRPGFDLSLVQRSEGEGQQRGGGDPGRPNDRLGGDRHVESVGGGDNKRVEAGRHCGKRQ
ncbi:MAG TPA: hypothetical protein VIH47_06550 [Solirubrobacterales bacterium]